MPTQSDAEDSAPNRSNTQLEESGKDPQSSPNLDTPPKAGGLEWNDYDPEETDTEDLALYRQGGLHPIIPGDFLGDDRRYEVVHKLGSGASSTVWLCHDTFESSWIAIKVLTANLSSGPDPYAKFWEAVKGTSLEEIEAANLVVHKREFWLHGPNGKHRCLVLQLLGRPAGDHYSEFQNPNLERLLKHRCYQMVEAVHFLQTRGLYHRKFSDDVVLMKMRSLDGIPKEEFCSHVPPPRALRPHKLIQLKGQLDDGHVPEYITCPANLEGLHWRYGTNGIAIIEAESSSRVPREVKLSLPSLDAPEIVFEGAAADQRAQIWSLANMIWRIRVGNLPFGSSWLSSHEVVIANMEFLLGQLPRKYKGPWETVLLGKRRGWKPRFHDDQDPEKVLWGNWRMLVDATAALRERISQEEEELKVNQQSVRGSTQDESSSSTSPRDAEIKSFANKYQCFEGSHRYEPVKLSEAFEGRLLGRYRVITTDGEGRKVRDDEFKPDGWIKGVYCRGDLTKRVTQFNTPLEQDLATDWPGCHPEPSPFWPGYDSRYDGSVDGEWDNTVRRVPDEEIPLLADLFGNMWRYNPKERSTTAEILEHPWFYNRMPVDPRYDKGIEKEQGLAIPERSDNKVQDSVQDHIVMLGKDAPEQNAKGEVLTQLATEEQPKELADSSDQMKTSEAKTSHDTTSVERVGRTSAEGRPRLSVGFGETPEKKKAQSKRKTETESTSGSSKKSRPNEASKEA
ncbi:protein kinase domain-containing protein [Seiridium cupressi]